jgi:hypothetical protein
MNIGAGLCFDTITITDTLLFSWDSSSTLISNQIVESSFKCSVGLTSGNLYNPFY